MGLPEFPQSNFRSQGGHELGSSLLFGYRLGFSGTLSNLLPQAWRCTDVSNMVDFQPQIANASHSDQVTLW